jgi:hypothetical protein
VAFKVGSSSEELRLIRGVLRDSGTRILYEAARGFTTSVNVLDPDDNEIELYVDASVHDASRDESRSKSRTAQAPTGD